MLGLHWVGDLIVDCEIDVQGASGAVLLDLVKGGRHFGCSIEVATGQARFSIDGLADWHPAAETAVRGTGKHRVMFANVDEQLLLWVDDELVTFDAPTVYPPLGNDRPVGSEDLAPVGVGSRGVALTVRHLRVLRDIYYIAKKTPYRGPISDYPAANHTIPWENTSRYTEFLSEPSEWENPRDGNVFDGRQAVSFDLGADQFFVLGDNSPASSDARLWTRQHFVERDLLVGKALLVYWPHPLELPIPFTEKSIGVLPNIPGMGLIR